MANENETNFGDARRCPRHPWITTSSPDGLFDAPCGACEAAMEESEEVETLRGAWETQKKELIGRT